MPYRDIHQRHATALRRASKAIERSSRATTPAEKEKARRWAEAWGTIAGIRATRHSPPSVADRP